MPNYRWHGGAGFLSGLDPLARLMREMERLGEFSPGRGDSRRVGGGSFPPLNVYNGEDEVVVVAEVAGVDPADLDVSITGETLVIKGAKKAPGDDLGRCQRREREFGQFGRTVILPDRVEAEKISAKLRDGMLTIRLPKSEAARPRQISVQSD